MSERVVRQDIVELSFDTDLKVLKEMLDELKKIRKAIDGIGNEDGMDELQKDTKEAATAAEKLNTGLKKVGSSLGNVTKKAAKLSFKGLALGISATTTAIGALTKQSVQAYSEYEQLVGGVRTLFGAKETNSVEEYAKLVGKSVSDVTDKYKELKAVEKQVVKDANNAFKTAGLSANEYMSTATTFSGALIQSLNGDTKKAAELTNLAITDMSDNANKMGTSMEMVQNAYSGFARGNYMMLDNLKLGYAGTKSELERLLKDAGELTGKTYSISSYADIIEAIHAIQTNIGITGTTAKEASKTIQGSFNSFRASWKNLLPALIQGDEEFEQCLDNLVDSAATFGKNVMPAIEKSLQGIGKLIERAAPLIEQYLPKIVEDLLPPMIKAGTSLFVALAKSFPTIVKTFIKELPNIAKEVWNGITDAFSSTSGNAGRKIATTIGTVVGGGVIAGFAAFKGIKGFQSLKSIFPTVGGAAGGVNSAAGPLSKLTSTKATTILKGMGNLALIIGGLTAIAAAMAFVAPKIASLTDTKSFLKLVGAIGLLGTTGAALAKFAGIVGVIPIPTVLAGLANIGLAIGGLTAVVSAFALLSKIPGFNDFIDKGGDAIANLFKQVGKVAGSIIGGIGEGVSDSFPEIGKNLSAFAEAIKPMFDTFRGVDVAPIGSFFKSMGSFMLTMTGSNVLGIFGGKTNLAEIGNELTTFATNSAGFFTKITTFPADSFTKATALFDALAGMKSLPKEGGVVSWFAGSINYENIAAGLGKLSDGRVVGFFTAMQGIPQESFANGTSLFNALAEMKSLPKEGGVVGWFGGSVNYENIASGLATMSGSGVRSFFEMVSGFGEQTFTNTTRLFETLGGISSLPKEGGFWQSVKSAVTGQEAQSPLASIANDLSNFAAKARDFFAQVNSLNLSNLNGLWDSLKKPEQITKDVSTVLGEGIKNIVNMVKKLPSQMGHAISSGAASFKSAVLSMWNSVIAISASSANTLVSTANRALSRVNALRVSARGYAGGTTGHKGGNALVNDGRGAELIRMPNGRMFLPQGRNVFLPNAPKGMMVLDAQKTAKLMGRNTPTFNYGSSKRTYSYAEGTVTPRKPTPITTNRTVTENNSYAPVFNLTITGSTDDRMLATRVKRWIQESIEENFEQMARNNSTAY